MTQNRHTGRCSEETEGSDVKDTHTHTAVNGSGSEKVSVSAATLDYSRPYVGLQSAENYISSAAIWCY